MKKRMNKKAQFYLIAAIIIVMAISGIASVKTYAIATAEPRKIKDIGSELREESARIIDYGIYSKENLTRILNNFTDEDFAPYFLKKTEGTNIVFVYGNKDELYSVQYNPDYTGAVFATIGGVAPTWEMPTIIPNRTLLDTSGDEVIVEILNREFSFKIRENEMFYFVITQEREGEIYVERN